MDDAERESGRSASKRPLSRRPNMTLTELKEIDELIAAGTACRRQRAEDKLRGSKTSLRAGILARS